MCVFDIWTGKICQLKCCKQEKPYKKFRISPRNQNIAYHFVCSICDMMELDSDQLDFSFNECNGTKNTRGGTCVLHVYNMLTKKYVKTVLY
jgi:hypothetical protein